MLYLEPCSTALMEEDWTSPRLDFNQGWGFCHESMTEGERERS